MAGELENHIAAAAKPINAYGSAAASFLAQATARKNYATAIAATFSAWFR